jgi:hypothetical protein
VADVYQAENECLKAENVELRRRLSNQQVTILNLQQELGEDAVRKIAVDKALALTRQAADLPMAATKFAADFHYENAIPPMLDEDFDGSRA